MTGYLANDRNARRQNKYVQFEYDLLAAHLALILRQQRSRLFKGLLVASLPGKRVTDSLTD